MSQTEKRWVLYAYSDEDQAPILESYNEKPSEHDVLTAHGGGALYEYDLVNGYAVEGVLVGVWGEP